jgi:hypothetical protein
LTARRFLPLRVRGVVDRRVLAARRHVPPSTKSEPHASCSRGDRVCGGAPFVYGRAHS